MKILISYKDGKIEEFNFERFTTSEVFKEKGVGNNICSDFILRTDYDIRKRGLFLDIHWYDTLTDKQTMKEELDDTGVTIYHAGREVGRRIALVSPEEIQNDIYEITVDDTPLIWNDNGDIINGRLFTLQENQLVEDKDTKCVAQKATDIFCKLKAAHPTYKDDYICSLFGYTPEAYSRACAAQGVDSPFSENPLTSSDEHDNQNKEQKENSESTDHQDSPQEEPANPPTSSPLDEWAQGFEETADDDE